MFRPWFLRPWFRTARPDDWLGRLMDGFAFVVLTVVVLVCLLGRLPTSWIVAVDGHGILLRVVLLLVVVPLWGWARAVVHALHPRTPYLLGRTLTVITHGERLRVRARDIVAIHVEQRSPEQREVLIVELFNGTQHDVCPTDWRGAGQLFRRLNRLSGAGLRNPTASMPGF